MLWRLTPKVRAASLIVRPSLMTANTASYRCSTLLSSTSTRPTSLALESAGQAGGGCQGSAVTASQISRYWVAEQELSKWDRSPVPIHHFVRPSGFEPETCGLRVR